MEKTLYLQVSPEEISKYVVLCGDPGRVEKIVTKLNNCKKIASNREYLTYTGFYKGIKITATSTGIGAPSAAIAIEEMYNCGMEVAVRVGTIMGLKDDLLGKLLIPSAVMKEDGTSPTYAPKTYPSCASYELVEIMNESSKEYGLEYNNGIICSMDGFYSQMKESKLSNKMKNNVNKTFENLKKYNISGIDMESSVILTLTNLMGIKGCIVTMTTVLENLNDFLKGEERTKAEDDLINVVLNGIVKYAKIEEEKNELV
ncbi:nucleoside phosphorylase [Oceanotoga sp. DSM 15011]|uniref:nucleoside phosphorylase n=1 Tax=Oceanotoga sp. DSM 15011 TaxID=2984951 RepID=UPI0021F43CC8|nr:nucleoside phosphorylase [Oceanotoga sp. DSM 15011]UYP01247.1 nucleoside phosphorylase [Oceanotoga sp. DSM 15011]